MEKLRTSLRQERRAQLCLQRGAWSYKGKAEALELAKFCADHKERMGWALKRQVVQLIGEGKKKGEVDYRVTLTGL